MYGIQETKQVVKLIIDFGNGMGAALEDSSFSWIDAPSFLPMLKDVPEAFSGIGKVPSELSDLTKEEVDELIAFVKEEFDIPEKDIEIVVEKALTFASQAYAFISTFFKGTK